MKNLHAILLSASLLSSCSIYKTEYSRKEIIPGIVLGKTHSIINKKYHGVSIYTQLGDDFAIFNYDDSTLHKSVDKDSLVNIVYREVNENKYTRDNELISKNLLRIKIYAVLPKDGAKDDSVRLHLKKEYSKF